MCNGISTYSVESLELEYLKTFLCREPLKKQNKIMQLPQSVINELEVYVNLSYELDLNFPLDLFVLLANNVHDCVKSDATYSVRFNPFPGEIRNPSLAAEFSPVRFTGINSVYSCPSLNDPLDHGEMQFKISENARHYLSSCLWSM